MDGRTAFIINTMPPIYEQHMHIPFPLSQSDLISLKHGYIFGGTATLTAGSVVVANNKIKGTSIAVVSYTALSAPGTLKAVCTSGTLTITSTSATDAGTVAYIIII